MDAIAEITACIDEFEACLPLLLIQRDATVGAPVDAPSTSPKAPVTSTGTQPASLTLHCDGTTQTEETQPVAHDTMADSLTLENTASDDATPPKTTTEPTARQEAAAAVAVAVAADKTIASLQEENASLRRQLEAALAVVKALEKENAVAHGEPVPMSPDPAPREESPAATPSQRLRQSTGGATAGASTDANSTTPARRSDATRGLPLRVSDLLSTPMSPMSPLMAPRGPKRGDDAVPAAPQQPPPPVAKRAASSKGKVDSWNTLARPVTLFSRHQNSLLATGAAAKKPEAPSLHRPLRQAGDIEPAAAPKSRLSSAAASRSNSPQAVNGTYRAPPPVLDSSNAPRARVRSSQPSLVRAALAEFRGVHPGEDLTMERQGTPPRKSADTSPSSGGAKVRIQRTALDV